MMVCSPGSDLLSASSGSAGLGFSAGRSLAISVRAASNRRRKPGRLCWLAGRIRSDLLCRLRSGPLLCWDCGHFHCGGRAFSLLPRGGAFVRFGNSNSPGNARYANPFPRKTTVRISPLFVPRSRRAKCRYEEPFHPSGKEHETHDYQPQDKCHPAEPVH